MDTNGDTYLFALVLVGRRCGLPTSGIPGVAAVDSVDGLVTRRCLTARGANISLRARGAGHGSKKRTRAMVVHVRRQEA